MNQMKFQWPIKISLMFRPLFRQESNTQKKKWKLVNIFTRIEAIKKLYPIHRRRTAEDYILKIKKEMLHIRKHCALMDIIIGELEDDFGIEYPNKKNIKRILSSKYKVGNLTKARERKEQISGPWRKNPFDKQK